MAFGALFRKAAVEAKQSLPRLMNEGLTNKVKTAKKKIGTSMIGGPKMFDATGTIRSLIANSDQEINEKTARTIANGLGEVRNRIGVSDIKGLNSVVSKRTDPHNAKKIFNAANNAYKNKPMNILNFRENSYRAAGALADTGRKVNWTDPESIYKAARSGYISNKDLKKSLSLLDKNVKATDFTRGEQIAAGSLGAGTMLGAAYKAKNSVDRKIMGTSSRKI